MKNVDKVTASILDAYVSYVGGNAKISLDDYLNVRKQAISEFGIIDSDDEKKHNPDDMDASQIEMPSSDLNPMKDVISMPKKEEHSAETPQKKKRNYNKTPKKEEDKESAVKQEDVEIKANINIEDAQQKEENISDFDLLRSIEDPWN